MGSPTPSILLSDLFSTIEQIGRLVLDVPLSQQSHDIPNTSAHITVTYKTTAVHDIGYVCAVNVVQL